MRIADRDKAHFEELDERRRRIDDDFNVLVQQMRDGSVLDLDRTRNEAQYLQVRHNALIQEMIELLNH
jgi:hypothetical protein